LARQLPLSQQPPAAHVFLAQQLWFAPPHGWQVPAEQASELPVHAGATAQHGCPEPPQVAQTPWLHPRPAPQAVPSQQGCPEAPHALQLPAMQRPPLWHCPPRMPPRQQGWFRPPQAWQVPLEQAMPLEQRLSQQQD
jgi:hypothetical protein